MDKRKNGEKPKILITESVKIGNHSTVFSVGESPNLKPNGNLVADGWEGAVMRKPFEIEKKCGGYTNI